MLKVKNVKCKQPTLGVSGFKKKVVHRGVEAKVKLPLKDKETLYNYKQCLKEFRSMRGRKKNAFKKNNCIGRRSWQTTKQNKETWYHELITQQVKSELAEVITQVLGSVVKNAGANKNSGKKRHQFTAVFKASAINDYGKGDFKRL